MVACTARSSPKPLRKRSVTRSSCSTSPIASGRSRRGWSACRARLRAAAGSRRTVPAWLIDVAMDQVLEAAGFAFQARQDLVGFPHLPNIFQAEPSTWAPFHISAASTTTTAEFKAAIDRMRQRIGTARSSWTMRKTAARGQSRLPFPRSVLLHAACQLTPPCEFVRSAAPSQDPAAPWRRCRP